MYILTKGETPSWGGIKVAVNNIAISIFKI
jgi:hypothetical protein